MLALALVSLLVTGCGDDGGSVQSATTAPASATAAARMTTIEPPAGWSQMVETLPPASSVARRGSLRLQVVGTCQSNNGQGMYLKGTGWPGNGYYRAQVLRPDGSEYRYYDGKGRFDKNGQPSGWNWNCRVTPSGQTDPVGTYTLKLWDATTGSPTESVGLEVPFTISYKG